MSDLATRIERLSREEALEAAQYVSRRVAGGEAGEAERVALGPIVNAPLRDVPVVEELARLVLLSAAADPELRGTVESAIEGAGRKNLILGGPEIVALAGIGLLALNTLLARGRTSEEESVEITEENGKRTIKIDRQVRYGVSGRLGEILSSYFEAFGGKSSAGE
jgi:hypothetical protein